MIPRVERPAGTATSGRQLTNRGRGPTYSPAAPVSHLLKHPRAQPEKKKKESSTNLQRCIPKILLQQFAARSFLHHGCFPSGLLETGFVPLSSSSSLKAGSFQHKVFQRKEKSTLTVAECLEAILGHAGFATSSAAHTCFFHLHVEDAHSQF